MFLKTTSNDEVLNTTKCFFMCLLSEVFGNCQLILMIIFYLDEDFSEVSSAVSKVMNVDDGVVKYNIKI